MLLTTIILVGFLLCIAGITLLLKPDLVIDFIERHAASQPLYASAIIIRVLFGLLLVTCADLSRYPTAVTALGWIAVIAGVVFAWMGHPRFTSMLEHIMKTIKPIGRVGGGLGLVFGLFLLYAFL